MPICHLISRRYIFHCNGLRMKTSYVKQVFEQQFKYIRSSGCFKKKKFVLAIITKMLAGINKLSILTFGVQKY